VVRTLTILAFLAMAATSCHTLVGYDEHHGGRHRSAYVVIPPRFLPPPGRCRVWIPEWRPARQPPPGRCGRLQYRVPPAGWLVVAPYDPGGLIEVWVYSSRVSRHDGLPWVVKILYVDPYTGELVAEEYM
jgi:hypothetical protein